MNIKESQAHAKGYSEGYHAAERDLYREIDALRKDKARLDWLIENASAYWVYTREDIDQAICHEHGLPSI